MSTISSSKPKTSYIPDDSILPCISFLNTSDLGNLCQVQKEWQKLFDGPRGQILWKEASIREGVPIVQGENRIHKDDFKFLRPITVNKKTFERYLGELVGDVPLMRADLFARLKKSKDPFEPKKFQKNNYIVLIDPAALKITVSPNRPLAMDATGTLVEVPVAERANIPPHELIVPFSFKNFKALVTYFPVGKVNRPVFREHLLDDNLDFFNQCNAPSVQNSILIMRKKNVIRDDIQVTNCGWEITTLRERTVYNSIKILKTGKCLEKKGQSILFVRSAERLNVVGTCNIPLIGHFIPKIGLSLGQTNGTYYSGIVPCIHAEVPKKSN
ncbi:MAG: hypothetical protein V4489_08075 [Chlamydiota bacterium]